MGYKALKKGQKSQKEIRRRLENERRKKEMYDDKGKLKDEYKNRKTLKLK